jgi:hypothetical protein
MTAVGQPKPDDQAAGKDVSAEEIETDGSAAAAEKLKVPISAVASPSAEAWYDYAK